MFEDFQFDAQQVQSVFPDYKFVKKLGVGSYGKVFLVSKKNEYKEIALKKIKCFGLCDYEKNNAVNEVRILASLNHSNVIKFYESLFDSTEQDLYIFMEYANEGDLSQIIAQAKEKKKRIAQQLIWKMIFQLADGLNYLHKNNILHRDIKPANIFKSESLFKLGDMNVSKILQPGLLAKTQIGSPLYTSPEIWNQNGYNEKCDIWSLGVVIYQLCTLKVPYQANSIEELVRKLKTQRLKNIPNGYSPMLNQLVHQMLQINPKRRVSAQRILQYCQQVGKGNKQQGIQIYAENMLDTIQFPETDQRWVNLVPLPPRMVKKESGQSIKKDSSKQKRQFGLNRSNIFTPNEIKGSIIRTSQIKKNAVSQQKLPRVRLPSITRRNNSQDQQKSRQKSNRTPQRSRKQIQGVKIGKNLVPLPNFKRDHSKNNEQNLIFV